MANVVENSQLFTKLRAIEKEIDLVHQGNPLMQENFATATWNLLTLVGRSGSRELHQEEHCYREDAFVLKWIRPMRFPLTWFLHSCSRDADLDEKHSSSKQKAACAIMNLARAYNTFSTIFTYWSAGEIELDLRGRNIIPMHDWTNHTEYEAYDAFIPTRGREGVSKSRELWGKIRPFGRTVRYSEVGGGRLIVDVTPQLVKAVREVFEPLHRAWFQLPENWRFSKYSLRDFRAIYSTMLSLAFIQGFVCESAFRRQPRRRLGTTLILAGRDDLKRRIALYSQVDPDTVSEVLGDLTYGGRGIRQPDPFLQPLIPLNEQQLAILPELLMACSPERNLCSLLNKIPEERTVYQRLTKEKESKMRGEIEEMAVEKGFRTWHGFVPGRRDLGDVDIAVVSEAERACVLAQLKWFIEPAEPREGINRNQEIKKGISQALTLNQAFLARCPELLSSLGITPEYKVIPLVISANWIGTPGVQHACVPVIEMQHLAEKIRISSGLQEVLNWLADRRYLPKEGRDYSIVHRRITVGNWTARWYGLGPQTGDQIRPL